jgi:hypothetical protein
MALLRQSEAPISTGAEFSMPAQFPGRAPPGFLKPQADGQAEAREKWLNIPVSGPAAQQTAAINASPGGILHE